MERQWRAVPCIQYISSLQDGAAYVCGSGTGSKAPQLVTGPLPVTIWALILWGRKTVKLVETSVEVSFKNLSLHSVEVTFTRAKERGCIVQANAGQCRVLFKVCCTNAMNHNITTASTQKCYCCLIQQSTRGNPVGGRQRPCDSSVISTHKIIKHNCQS